MLSYRISRRVVSKWQPLCGGRTLRVVVLFTLAGAGG